MCTRRPEMISCFGFFLVVFLIHWESFQGVMIYKEVKPKAKLYRNGFCLSSSAVSSFCNVSDIYMKGLRWQKGISYITDLLLRCFSPCSSMRT